jgi:polyisoprenoid-binding protein YceI
MAAALLSAGLLLAQPAAYEFRPAAGGRFALIVEKTGLWSGKKHIFEFERYSAKASFDRSAPEKSQVEFRVEANSATCKDAWVSEKDRRTVLAYMLNDMLEAEKHPQLVFRSTKVARTGERSYDLDGLLTVRGIEKPAKVAVTVEERDGAIGAVIGRSVVLIKDYGLKPPKAALGAIGTKNEMTVEFRLIAAGT